MLTTLLLAASACIFLLFSAFFSASETALFSIPRERILFFQNNPRRSYRWVYSLLQDGQRTLLMILLGNIFVNITIAGLIHSVIERTLHASSALTTLFVATAIIVVFGEMLPKNIALKSNERMALLTAPGLYFLTVLCKPLLDLVRHINVFFLMKFRERLAQPSPFVTIEELKTGVMESAREGAIAPREQSILMAILNQGAQPVRKMMTHRSKVLMLRGDLKVKDALERLRQKKELSALVYKQNDPRTILGFVRLSSLLGVKSSRPIAELVSEPVWIPETMEVADLISFLFNEGHREACVLDELGSFSGVFSLSVGIRKILGHSASRAIPPSTDLHTLVFSGTADIESVREWLPPSLIRPDGELRTLNGLLTNHLGKIPKTGDTFAIDGWNFYIIKASPTMIESVLIRKRNTV